MTDGRLEKILESAADLFIKIGFRKTNMEDISRESGISVGVIYGYFENKSCVFSAVLKQVINPEYFDSVKDFPLRQADFSLLENEYKSAMEKLIRDFAQPLRQRREDYTYDLMLGDAYDMIAPLGTASMILEANPRLCPVIYKNFNKARLELCKLIEGYLHFYMATGEVRTLLSPDLSARFLQESMYWWSSMDHHENFDPSTPLISPNFARAVCLKAMYYANFAVKDPLLMQ